MIGLPVPSMAQLIVSLARTICGSSITVIFSIDLIASL